MKNEAVIFTRQDFEDARKRGFNPLCENAWELPMEHNLRLEMQRELFGKNDANGNNKFYKYCLAHKRLICEECKRPIDNPSAFNVSHILSRGAHPEMAHDPRNVNILCPKHHEQWEHATTRQGMLIEKKNKKKIEILKKEYR